MAEPAPRRGLLIDFGGVLTTDVFASFRAFCAAEGLEPDAVLRIFREDEPGRQLLFDLETGALTEAEFEPRFAALLSDGRAGGVAHAGLIDRLFGAMRPDEEMLAAVAGAKRAGVRTCLVSNSWGHGRYDRSRFPDLFTAVVISGEVGLRKPEEPIYRLACERVGLAPEDCVFVDDLPHNLKPARAMGMETVLHRSATETVPHLGRLFGVALDAGP